MNTNTRFALGILADHVGVDKMPEGGSAMWAVPGLLDLAHVSDLVERFLRPRQGKANTGCIFKLVLP